jgi:hypothetical protein
MSERGGAADVTAADWSIQPGMEVVDVDRHFVGLVTHVREQDFLVRRSMLRDAYVPLGAVREISGDGRVVLAIRADVVDTMGWPSPLDPAADGDSGSE